MAKSREQETAVATTSKNQVAKAEPVSVGQLADDAAEFGMQFDRQDLAVPFLRVIQSNSPQTTRGHQEYMEEARSGQFFNTATRQIWDGEKGILFQPVTYQRSFIEWRPREQGGGFVKDHGTDDSLLKTTHRNDKNKDILPNGNEFTTNALYYGFVVDPERGSAQQVAFVLSGTQLKKSRKFNTALETMTRYDEEADRHVKVPPFYRLWRVTTVPESNEKGNWFGLKLEPNVPVFEIPNGELLYEAAKKMFRQVGSGELRTAEPVRDAVDEPDDAKVPF